MIFFSEKYEVRNIKPTAVRTAAALLAAALFLLPLAGCASSLPLENAGTDTEKNTSADISADINEAEDLNRYEIVIPGLEKEYELLYLTDTHIILPEKSDSKKIRDYSNTRRALFSRETHIQSSDRFSAWLAYAKDRQADALLLGGDIIDSPSSANMDFLASSLDSLPMPYIYTLGNHDWTFPWEYMTEAGKEKYLPGFAGYMGGNTAIHTLELEEITIVAVDNSSNQINPDALEAYREILAKNKPVILLLHVPLYTDSLFAKTSKVWKSGVTLGGGIHGGIYPDATSTEFIRLTTAKNSPVAAILAGHVHLEDQSDLPGEKTIPQITGDAGYKGKASLIHITGTDFDSLS